MTAKRLRFALGPLLLIIAGAVSARAAQRQDVEIQLQDSSTDPAITHMRVVVDQAKLKPGKVRLRANNESKTLVHEVLIARNDSSAELPVDAAKDRVVEARVHPLGEISDLKPGKSGTMTLTLKPGRYVVFCNEPGHYADGMYAKLTVAP